MESTSSAVEDYAVVVGGANLDVGGRSAKTLVVRDSNPGRVRTSPGGVGRNIAHNMALLGVKIHLLTAMGDDPAAQALIDGCHGAGVGVEHVLRVPGAATSTYLFIAGPDGDMELAVSDMEVCGHITPEYLAGQETLLQNARLVVVDANIPAPSIVWLAENCRAPLFADPVSVSKAAKLRPVLGKLHTLKPNRIEAELLSGIKITGGDSLRQCASALLASGLKQVFISLGGRGVLAADCTRQICLPCLEGRAVNTTGCGDAFMAAAAWASMRGAGLEYAAQAGLAAAAITMESVETISPNLSPSSLRTRMGALCAGSRGG